MPSPLLAPALVETGLIVYRDIKTGANVDNPVPHFPLPSQFVSVVIVYGLLGVVPKPAERVAALVGWGFVIATALNLWTPGGKVAKAKSSTATKA
jgi:hypothetical protein